MRWARLAGTAAADLVWPRLCAACDAEADEGREPLCGACRLELEEMHEAACCGACGKPASVASPESCPYCDGRGHGPVRRTARLGTFAGPVQALVHRAKYRGRWELATALGDLLAATAAVREVVADDAVVVPVPLHGRRRRERGYDQAELIARPVAALNGTRPIEALARVRATRPQAALANAAERRANVRSAFVLLRPEAVAGRPVVIVDDVLTTGATLRAAARALEPAKPASLAAVVVGVADPTRHRVDPG